MVVRLRSLATLGRTRFYLMCEGYPKCDYREREPRSSQTGRFKYRQSIRQARAGAVGLCYLDAD